ncbi:MAG: metallophosphoesterase [Angelakisella sp.]
MKNKNAAMGIVAVLCATVLALSAVAGATAFFGRNRKPAYDAQQYLALRALPENRNITYPRFATPSIQPYGGELAVLMNAPAGMAAPEEFEVYAASPKAAEAPVALEVTGVTPVETGWRILVKIPQDSPEGLYDLVVVAKDGKKGLLDVSNSALSIVSRIPEEFSVLQVTDIHYNTKNSNGGDKQNPSNYLLGKIMEQVNAADAAFVLNTGDFCQSSVNTYDVDYPEFASLWSQTVNKPTYAVMGNHDGFVVGSRNGYEYFNQYMGQQYYSFDYGNWHFVGVNSYEQPPNDVDGGISKEQLAWIDSDLANARAADKNIVMFSHHTPFDSDFVFWDDSRFALLEVIDRYGVKLYLSGHRHTDQLDESATTKFISTRTAQNAEPDGVGYRVLRFAGNSVESIGTAEPKAASGLTN